MMAAGEFAPARQNLETALKTPSEWIGDHDLHAMLVDLAARQRDEAAIRQYAPLAEELATRYDHTLYQAIAHRAWGVAHRLAGEYAAARARLNQALTLFSELNTRWQMGRTLFELGELAAAQTNTTEANDHFIRALAAFEEMQAAPDVTRTRIALEALK
jgi:tetratricopeptide (TPR) repeat protein